MTPISQVIFVAFLVCSGAASLAAPSDTLLMLRPVADSEQPKLLIEKKGRTIVFFLEDRSVPSNRILQLLRSTPVSSNNLLLVVRGPVPALDRLRKLNSRIENAEWHAEAEILNLESLDLASWPAVVAFENGSIAWRWLGVTDSPKDLKNMIDSWLAAP
jgi:hypothetical protein